MGLFGMTQMFSQGDNCGSNGSISREDLLYCTICDAEVYKFSKHCRSCDKCVEGFDHHCRWLNNCIGRKNYMSFVALTGATLIMLFIETISGMFVVIRCFTDKHEVRTHLTNKLGNGISVASFSAFMVLCTLAPLCTSIPLGELFLFHMLLIRKGITTYEYVIAMRTQIEPRASAQVQKKSSHVQRSGSITRDWSSPNSISLPHLAACCIPRSVEQGEGTSHLDKRKLPCTVDPESTTVIERTGHRSSKHAIKISALRLAMLNSKEVAMKATKVRENSSIFRPLGFQNLHAPDKSTGVSHNVTPRSSNTLPTNDRKDLKRESENLLNSAASYSRQETKKKDEDREITNSQSTSPGSEPLSPLPVDRSSDNVNIPRSSVGYMQVKEQGAARNELHLCNAAILPHPLVEFPSWICTTPLNEGLDSARGSETVQLGRSRIICMGADANSGKCGNNRTALYWDRASGRFRSVPIKGPNMKAPILLPNPTPLDPSGVLGPNSISSPGRSFVHPKPAALHGQMNTSALKNGGKENNLKLSRNDLSSFSGLSHIVLPRQGLTTSVCQSSSPAYKAKPKVLSQ
ncbi:hypothetical protein KP509_21G026700 [Ceratopteris richardii]|nr:hypothetical protein KP509_21G026700 [Ceratopteris richardii]